MDRTRLRLHAIVTVGIVLTLTSRPMAAEPPLREEAAAAIHRAASFYQEEVASHGGYVYYYAVDLRRRWGEGEATADQIWVQPPGTPTVGMAFLEAFEATGNPNYLVAATHAAEALVYGQLESGGWTNCIDFDPRGTRVAAYRNGRGRGKNNASLDDGQTQSAIRLLVRVDAALGFRNAKIHEAAIFALDALLDAQFPCGGFPQVWTGPVPPQPVCEASYPDDDWQAEGRIKEYWNMYTLNDNVTGYVAETLLDAHEVYADDRYLDALRRLGDFLLLAQMPEPQPGWAQQYDYRMRPIWARKFEPPAVAADETQEAIATLMRIYRATSDPRYLEPIASALAWLERSKLPSGRLARYYELETNRPLYMTRRGKVYRLTYNDSDLPSHYGWKVDSRIAALQKAHEALRAGQPPAAETSRAELESLVRRIIDDLDAHGRWISTYEGERLVGQPKFPVGYQYISSEVFSRNVMALSRYVAGGAD